MIELVGGYVMADTVIILSDISADQGFVISGGRSYDGAGIGVAGAGDINGDGIDDVVIGAPFNNRGGSLSGSAFAVYGTDGAHGNVNLPTLNDAAGFTIIGDLPDDFAGWSVSAAGDMNGDGVGDLIIGAYGQDTGGVSAGAAHVVFGRAGTRGSFDLTGLSTADGFAITGDLAGDLAGWSVHAAGDINGDGLADVIVGAPDHDMAGVSSGVAYVIYGRTGPRTALDLSTLAATDGFAIVGGVAGDRTGISVAAAGDVNGDGIDDLVLGANGNDTAHEDAGAAYVLYGQTANRGSVDLLTLGAEEGFVLTGAAAFDGAGVAVSGAGDVNGDGLDDIIVGSDRNDATGNGAGGAYVIYGRAGERAAIGLDVLTSADGFAIRGAAAGDFAGTDVAAAGDVNGDGMDDLIVGAPLNDTGAPDAGAAYVIYGRTGVRDTLLLASLAETDGFAIVGDLDVDSVGMSVAAAGDVNNDGVDDLIIGARYFGSGYNPVGTTYVLYGVDQFVGNSAPFITSNGGADQAALALLENGNAVTTVTAMDNDSGTILSYALAGGADSALFSVDQASGELRFLAAPDFEQPADADGDNIYHVIVRASDGALFDEQVLHITVTDVAEVNPGVTIVGTAGNDIIAGKKTVAGQPAPTIRDDIILGMDGNDRFDGGLGRDRYEGGAGDDVYVISEAGDVVIETENAGTDSMESGVSDFILAAHVEKGLLKDVRGLGADLDITGNSLANSLTGNSGANMLDGGAGNDLLNGKSGADILLGGEGNDTLNGGAGMDQLSGGIGADLFKYDNFALDGATDTITDFNRAEGDRISLAALDANGAAAGNGKFAFVGMAAFSGAGGELRFAQSGGNTFILADIDGDMSADLTILAHGSVAFVASDFLL